MRSGAVVLGMVSSLAMALTSCSSDVDKRCVDTTNYKTVTDSLCRSASDDGYSDTARYQWYAKGGNSTFLPGYHRYYGSSSSSGGGGTGTTHVSGGSGSSGSSGSEDGDSGSKGVSRGGLGHGSHSSGG